MGFSNSGGSVRCRGVAVDTLGILGGVRCVVCTLGGVGSGACVSGVVQSGTLGGIRGVVGNCAGQADGSTRAVSSLSGIVELKMADSCRRACIWSLSNSRKGDAGVGRRSASVRILAASGALLADDVVSISMLCGENPTVRAMRSLLVFYVYCVASVMLWCIANLPTV